MSRTRRIALLLCVLGAVLAMAIPAGAYHGTTCSVSGSTTSLTVGVPNGPFLSEPSGANSHHVYKFTLPAGSHILLMPMTGDVDMQVCKVGSTGHVCSSQSLAGWPDGCVAAGLGGNPGWGPPIVGPGTFRLDAIYCFGAACGYEDTGAPVAYGVIIAKP